VWCQGHRGATTYRVTAEPLGGVRADAVGDEGLCGASGGVVGPHRVRHLAVLHGRVQHIAAVDGADLRAQTDRAKGTRYLAPHQLERYTACHARATYSLSKPFLAPSPPPPHKPHVLHAPHIHGLEHPRAHASPHTPTPRLPPTQPPSPSSHHASTHLPLLQVQRPQHTN
jgi:hypothetical protein